MNVDWLTINPLTGGTGETEIYAYVTANERAGSIRNATVRFTNNEGLTADLLLSQSSDTTDMRFVVTPDYFYVPGGGGTFFSNVLSNTYWRVTEYDSGITITTENQEGYGDGILKIVIPPNPNTNNQYKYDHYGRPFYGRTGYITVTSLMGEKQILWEQAAYNAITVDPNRLVFPQSGGTLPVIVRSSVDWQITSYDTATTTFSALSGTSGSTAIYVTKAGLTENQLEYYSTAPSTAVFTDGMNTAVLELDSTIDDYYINDDWITVTYNVPSADTEVLLFGHLTEERLTPEVVFQDDEHSEIYGVPTRIGITSDDDRVVLQYLTVFTTPGLHTIKMRFNKEGSIIPHWGFPDHIGLNPRGTICYEKIVIGNEMSGFIEACAAINSGFKEVILGTGDITGVGEFAFLGCGSEDKDFVLGNNVKNLMYEPFHNFTARKFVFNQDKLGGTAYTLNREVARGDTGITISGKTYTFYDYNATRTDVGVSGDTYVSEWFGYMGDITCTQFVVGDKVSEITTNPFYPFGAQGVYSGLSNTPTAFTYAYAGVSYGKSYPITGCTVPAIYCIPKTAPVAETYDFTPTIQEFKKWGRITGTYGFEQTFRIGPERDIPFHYPVGADYNAYEEYWPNMIGDLDV